MALDPGKLRTKLTLVEKVATAGHAGGRHVQWADKPGIIWAQMEPMRSAEAIVAGVERSSTLYRITIRHRPDITVQHRFRWAGGLLDIRSADDPDQRREALVVTAETVSA